MYVAIFLKSFWFYPQLLWLILSIMCGRANSQVDSACRHPLGMQDKRIVDSSLTASSQHAWGTQAKFARLGRDEGDGAWCPLGTLFPKTEAEYLQIHFKSFVVITTIATQGRYGDGKGREFVPTYMFNYSRDGRTWHRWSDLRGVNKLKGNSDTIRTQQQLLAPRVIGVKYVRIIPVTSRPKSVCLRLELYGCAWKSGLISYEIPAPDNYTASEKPSTVSPIYLNSLSDNSYDGQENIVRFSGGLGQLSDGVIGDKDIRRIRSKNVPQSERGFDYVGWSNSPNKDKVLTWMFQFSDIRNFTAMKIHCNNEIASGAKLFSSIKVSFSLDGKTFPKSRFSPHISYYVEDDIYLSSQFLTIPLNNAVGRFIQARITIRGRLLLVSEIEFINEPLTKEESVRFLEEIPVVKNEIVTATNQATVSPNVVDHVPVIVGCLVGVIVLLILIVLGLCYRQHRLRKTLTPPHYLYNANTGRIQNNNNEHMVTLTPIVRQTGSGSYQTTLLREKPPIPIYQEIDASTSALLPRDNVYLQPSDVVMTSPPPYEMVPLVADIETQAGTSGLRFPEPDVVKDIESNAPSHYAETDLIQVQTIQGVTGGNIYAVPWTVGTPDQKRRIKNSKKNNMVDSDEELADNLPQEFPRNKLEFVEQLGEGQFGEVQLCKAHPCIRKYSERFLLPGEPESPVLVAVKILREDASPNAKEDFLKEVNIMAKLRHPNIVRLVAVCTTDEPYAMVTEYVENGDLNQYLATFNDTIPGVVDSSQTSISNDAIMKMASQIASGMAYLASLNFVHRDLATRNCLVSLDHSIRIADFGMSRDMYQSDYYRIQGRAVLPIRWMSWECVLMGKFSSASDIWSFGVTLWEMFSLCKHQPYFSFTDQQVIENMHHMFRRTGDEVFLPRPKRCPTSIFNFIKQCWKRSTDERPTFQQMHSYLLERLATKTIKPLPPKVKPPPLS